MKNLEPPLSGIRFRRRIGWIFLFVGLGILVSVMASELFGFQWLRLPYLPPVLSGVLGVFFLLLLYVVWRCPRCGHHLGRLDSKFCIHCGLPLTQESSKERTWQVDAENMHKEFVRTAEWLKRIESFQPVLLLVGFSVGTVIFCVLYGFPDSLINWVGMVLLSLASAGVLRAVLYNPIVLYYWRCPACGNQLPMESGLFFSLKTTGSELDLSNCPHCRVKLSETEKPSSGTMHENDLGES